MSSTSGDGGLSRFGVPVGACTAEQWEMLKAIGEAAALYEVVLMLLTQIAAMRALLITKGLASEEELTETLREIEAGVAVDKALSPEIAALEQIRRLMIGDSPPETAS